MGVVFGNGDGTFGPRQTFAVPVGSFAVADLNHDARPDLIVVHSTGTASEYLATPDGSLTGETYTIVQRSNTIQGTSAADQITLTKDPAGPYIDWTIGSTSGQMLVNDPAGLTITGNGSNDLIAPNYVNGNPFPQSLILNGAFTFNSSVLQGFSLCTIKIGTSALYFPYTPGFSPLNIIQQALKTGYHGGAWNGAATLFSGAITSSAAASNPAHNTSVGYADSADGTGANTTPNSVEVKYTLAGDANLDGSVDVFDLNATVPNFNKPGSWTTGDFNYSNYVDIFDLNALLPNFNHSLPAAATPAPQTTSSPATQLSASQVLSAASTQTSVQPPRETFRQSNRTTPAA